MRSHLTARAGLASLPVTAFAPLASQCPNYTKSDSA